ncbi:MAG TPA: NAD-dependent epimerase/dehydratase family protein [Candidatus Limnocylindrales bacterium]|jgi:nucleoside-diphosphate-sugar epimerase|nr:NAD-dependent epimerase/dehydratase family protein [Candidatus Limnocylindrales bacterium]
MKILLIGGNGFIGRPTAAALLKQDHQVSVFHRGNTPAPEGTSEIIGDHSSLPSHRSDFERERFDVVVDFILSSEPQAKLLMDIFRGITARVVGLSSMDVYRAWGIFYGFESGELQKLPVTEDSDLRTSRNVYPPAALARVRNIYGWIDDEYDKIPVEQTVLGDPLLPGTVIRLPMVYGPGDPVHRFHPVLKRINDGRRQIIFADDLAPMRTPRGYVEDMGYAIALAATLPQAAGRIYNVCESDSFGELDWGRKIAAAVNWNGEFIVLPHDQTPKHLLSPGNPAQHLTASSERIRKELGYREQVPREEAIRRTIQWERSHVPAAELYPFDYPAEDAALKQAQTA